MYQPTTALQFCAQLNQAIGENLRHSGFGQVKLQFEPNCRGGQLIRLENTVYRGFDLAHPQVRQLLKWQHQGAIDPDCWPVWELLQGRVEAIVNSTGYGGLELIFQRIKRDRVAAVRVQGGPSELIYFDVRQ